MVGRYTGHWVIDRSKRSFLAVKVALVALSAFGGIGSLARQSGNAEQTTGRKTPVDSLSLVYCIQHGTTINNRQSRAHITHCRVTTQHLTGTTIQTCRCHQQQIASNAKLPTRHVYTVTTPLIARKECIYKCIQSTTQQQISK